MKNQIPLTFNKVTCIRTHKSWYEPKEYVMTSEEKIFDYDTINQLRCTFQMLRAEEEALKKSFQKIGLAI